MKKPNAAYVAYRAGSAVARALPARSVPRFSALSGRVAARLMHGRRFVVERNLRRVLGPDLGGGDLDHLVAETFESYAHYWIESFRLPGTSPEVLDAGITTEGLEHVLGALGEGRGAILAMPHLGSWEWAAFWLATVQGVKITAVVEPVQPPELAEWFVGLRRRFGIQVVPLGPEAATASLKALRDNHVLCLMSDRDLVGNGIEVDLFGERTTLPGGPATLALRSDAALIPAAVYVRGVGHHGVAHAPLDTERTGRLRDDVTRVTADLARHLEDLIRAAPEQWHLLQPNWPSDREALARREAAR